MQHFPPLPKMESVRELLVEEEDASEDDKLRALITADAALKDAHREIRKLRESEKRKEVLEHLLDQANRDLAELRINAAVNAKQTDNKRGGRVAPRGSLEDGLDNVDLARVMVEKAKEELDATKAMMREAEERCVSVEVQNAELQSTIRDLRRAAAASPPSPTAQAGEGRSGEGVSVRWVAKQLAVTVQDVTHIGGCLAALDVNAGDKAVVHGLQNIQVCGAVLKPGRSRVWVCQGFVAASPLWGRLCPQRRPLSIACSCLYHLHLSLQLT